MRITVLMLATALSAGMASAQTEIALKPLKATPEAESLYQLTLTLAHPLPPKAAIELEFVDRQIDLQPAKIAGSNQINGGIALRKTENKLTLERSGLGDAIPAGKSLTLFFGPLKNPSKAKNTIRVHVTLNAEGFDPTKVSELTLSFE